MKKQEEIIGIDEMKFFFEAVLGGSFVDLKKEEKEFENKINKIKRKLTKKEIDLIKELVEKSRSVEGKNKISFIRNLKKVVWKIPSKQAGFVADFILENIQNENGSQRQACINLFNDWFFTQYHLLKISEQENKADLPEDLYRFLSGLKDLIKKHKPKDIVISDNIEDDPDYLDELKPSIYKSLVLLWEESTGRRYRIEEILENYPEFKISVPKRNYYQDDYWAEEDEIDPEEEMLNLWNGVPVDMEVFSALSTLESLMETRFKKELDNLGFDKDFSKNLIEELRKCPVFQEATMVPFQKMTMNYLRRRITPDEADALVRAFLLFSSHRIIENSNREPMSQMLANVAVAKAEMSLNGLDDMKSFLFRMRDTHLIIDKFSKEFCEEKIKERERNFTEPSDEKEKKLFSKITDQMNKSTQDSMDQACSIAHHCFDWFVQAEPQAILSKTPEKWAALAYFFVRKFNYENFGQKEGCGLPDYDNNDLDKLGGWGKGGVTSGSIRFYYTIIHAIQDPELMFLKSTDEEE